MFKMINKPEHALLPAGLTDLLPPFAAHEEMLATELKRHYSLAGYELVKPPLLEFESALLKGIGADVAKETYRLMDPLSNRMMAVRADITPQIARLAWTQLSKSPRPLRIMYDGEVLRATLGGIRKKRGFRTVGLELIGSNDAAMADAEVILLAVESLLSAGINGLTVDINVPSMAQSICKQEDLTLDEIEVVLQALSRKDRSGIQKVLGSKSSKLLTLISAGGEAGACLDQLAGLGLPDDAALLNRRLREVVSLVRSAQPELNLTIDPAETRGFEYHLGISFAIFCSSSLSELGMGGRYQSNEREMATGFSIFMDVLTDLVPRAPSLKRLYIPFGVSLNTSRELREAGWVVIHGLVSEKNVEEEARRSLCSHFWADGQVNALLEPLDRGGT